MGRLDGKVAFISGAARGQGRSHARCLAEQGADLILFDLCGPVAAVEYPMPTWDDLVETATMVEDLGRRVVARQADVRDYDAVLSVFTEGVEMLGRVDIVLANA
jgi:NAD(P)-dependent dehydrogenase (short-subunit alcohol dehydrogenase family)